LLLKRRNSTALLAAAVVLVAAARIPAPIAAAAATSSAGYDVSWPQCGGSLPRSPLFDIVGVTGGLPYSSNPCLASEYKWGTLGGKKTPDLYMNLAEPGSQSIHWNKGGPRPCSGVSDDPSCAYDYGWQAAGAAFGVAVPAALSSGRAASASRWWLDIETTNTWSSSTGSNVADIQGALDSLHAHGVLTVGVYSTAFQWGAITGGWQVAGAPDWLAGAGGLTQAASWCRTARSFSGGRITLVQYPKSGYDADTAC
jgi:hypothetical protein